MFGLVVLVCAVSWSCAGLEKTRRAANLFFMASTIGPIDAGIVDVLENEFEKETGIRVRHVGAGTGAALDIAKKGTWILFWSMRKSLEEKFVKEGFGTERIDLMYNDFVIVGPSADPAGIKGMTSAIAALKTIAAKQVTFISRGDKSGTHVAEMELWEKAGIKPSGSWYVVYEKGAEGNAPTLKYTDQKGAYTFIDRATLLTLKDQIKLAVLVEKDEALLNYHHLDPCQPKEISAGKLCRYHDIRPMAHLTRKGADIIVTDFGKDKYGSPLFFPNSVQWRMKHGQRKLSCTSS